MALMTIEVSGMTCDHCTAAIEHAVALVGGQLHGEQVDPAVDDVGHRRIAVKEAAQEPLDLPAGGVDDRGGEFLLPVREVVIKRPGLDVRGFQDLIHPRGRIALPAKQQGRGVHQGGTASVGAGHPLTILERSLKNT